MIAVAGLFVLAALMVVACVAVRLLPTADAPAPADAPDDLMALADSVSEHWNDADDAQLRRYLDNAR